MTTLCSFAFNSFVSELCRSLEQHGVYIYIYSHKFGYFSTLHLQVAALGHTALRMVFELHKLQHVGRLTRTCGMWVNTTSLNSTNSMTIKSTFNILYVKWTAGFHTTTLKLTQNKSIYIQFLMQERRGFKSEEGGHACMCMLHMYTFKKIFHVSP